jgi:hypothetical protein
MASWTVAGEYLKNGNVREVPVYQGAWTGASVVTDYGAIENVATVHPVGSYAAPVVAGDFVRWYTSADGTVEKMVAADDGKLLVGIMIDNPHGKAGGTQRAKVYFLAPGDIILCECDVTHAAFTVGLAIDIDVIAATALHGYTVIPTAGTGMGYAMDALALNTIGFIRVLVTTGIPGI